VVSLICAVRIQATVGESASSFHATACEALRWLAEDEETLAAEKWNKPAMMVLVKVLEQPQPTAASRWVKWVKWVKWVTWVGTSPAVSVVG
jgi:hypothetical protein